MAVVSAAQGGDGAIRDLATRAGLLPEWRDIEGKTRTVSVETLRAVLGAMGLSTEDHAAADRRLAESDALGGFLSADAGRRISLDVDGRGSLMTEDGAVTDVDPRGFTVESPGYHRLELRDRVIDLAVAPPRAPDVATVTGRSRAWGTAAQIYGLRDGIGGVGDFAGLARFARAAAGAGAQALAISPVHALFAADPGRFSPYSPSSRDFLNVLYADPGADADEPRGGDLVDWRAASEARLGSLRAGYERFEGDAGFERFVAEGGDPLRGHALFEALDAHFVGNGGPSGWQNWPEAYRDPASEDVARFAELNDREVRYHLYLQWLADRSLGRAQAAARDGGMKIGLIADLAVGLDTGGSHAWSRRGELIAGLSVGAPPDYFQPEGQGWGITGFSPIALKQHNYEPYLRILRTALRHAGGVRIDHAIGLDRLWVIPDGAGPKEGVYMRYPLDDMLRLLALEASRAGAVVIGEDLGVVPDGLREKLADRHVLGMAVLPFERGEEGRFTDPKGWRGIAAAMTSTHDLTPMAGWWQGIDLDWRDELGTVVETREQREQDRRRYWNRARESGAGTGEQPADDRPGPAVDAAVALTALSDCELAIIPAEDLFGLEQAPNLPGTTDEHPNWRRRLPDTADALFADPAIRARTELLNGERP
jgi:4-alpha-glucanotransferase